MRTYPRSTRSFNVRSPSGAVLPTGPRYTSGLVAAVGGAYAAVTDEEVISVALRIVAKRLVRSNVLRSPGAAREYLALRLAGLEHEVFACLYIDNRHHVIACDELFRGTIDGASVHPREVVKQALCYNAAAVILAHNHPSGVAVPSQADELVTRRLKEALALVDVRVLDHLIIGGATIDSFAERGLL